MMRSVFCYSCCQAALSRAFLLSIVVGTVTPVIAQDRLELGLAYRNEGVSASVPFTSPAVAPATLIASQTETLIGYDHGDPTEFEQLMLELVNRARRDPGAEAARLGIDLNQGLAPGTITDVSKPPLAPNIFLTASARAHSSWMLLADVFSHTGENGSTASERMSAAGYLLSGSWSSGENIAWSGSTGPVDLGQLTVQMHEGLFESPGHRTNICEGNFQELGIGIHEGLFFSQGTNWNAGMTTQNFARSSVTPGPYVTGVVYQDTNENDFYDLGEGVPDVVVRVSGSSYYGQSSASGGYAVPLTNDSATAEVTFSGDGWEESRTVSLEPDTNLKVDLVLGEATSPPTWEPQGWVYFNWPYAYSFSEGRWRFFNTSDTQWRVDLTNGQWGELADATGWNYYNWPYSYSTDEGTWHWYNADTQWVVDLISGVWALLGESGD